MAWWEGRRILAGRDLEAGGTWLGVTPDGRFAALTNHRDPSKTRPDRATRGQLPVRFLETGQAAADFLEELRPAVGRYNPFNLLVYDGRDLLGFESRHEQVVSFAPGVHALSNGDFNEPWPKAERLRAGLAEGDGDDEALLALLRWAEPFPDERLPSTGVSLAWERALSPAFIRTPTYGTRASTILRLGQDAISLVEQQYSAAGTEGRSEFQFRRT
jgi:uncharacterized protein with NRDE domain